MYYKMNENNEISCVVKGNIPSELVGEYNETDKEIVLTNQGKYKFADEVTEQEMTFEDIVVDDTPTVADLVEAISILTDYVFGESEVTDNG